MGKDCDLRYTDKCFNRITNSIRYYINLSDKYGYDDAQYEDHWLRRVFVFPEGMCIECFLTLKNKWFDKINENEIIPTEEFIDEIKTLFPKFEKTEKITWGAWYESYNSIENQISFKILNDYENDEDGKCDIDGCFDLCTAKYTCLEGILIKYNLLKNS